MGRVGQPKNGKADVPAMRRRLMSAFGGKGGHRPLQCKCLLLTQSGYEGPPGLPWSQEYSAYRALHGTEPDAVQGLLAELAPQRSLRFHRGVVGPVKSPLVTLVDSMLPTFCFRAMFEVQAFWAVSRNTVK